MTQEINGWVGDLFEFEYPDELGLEYVHEMCKKELVNMVLFNYNIRIVEEFGEGLQT